MKAARRNQAGFTMIELLLAIFVLLLVVGALAALFVESNDSSFASQREFSRLSVLQQQIERIRQTVKQYGFSALALTSNPPAPTDATLPADPTDPDDFITGYGTSSEAFRVHANYNNTYEGVIAGTPAGGEPLLVNGVNGTGGGQVAPVQYADLTTGATSSSPPSGDPYVTVYTYVTQTNAVGCNSSLGSCAGDARRVVLAVVLQPALRTTTPQYPTYSTTIFVNPTASNQPNKPSGLTLLGLIS
jgi:prepilin-type N-terminal cleavage/methylation domain-containing protein